MVFEWLGLRTRVVEEEYECRLRTAGGEDAGKAEWKRYGDGGRRLKVRFRGLDVAEGVEVEVALGSHVAGRVRIEDGRGRLVLEDEAPGDEGEGEVPPARNGDEVEIRAPGEVLLSGTLRPD